MRTIVFLVVAGIIIVLGYWLIGDHAKHWGEEVKESITDASSDRHLIKMTEGDMAKAHNELKKHWSSIFNVRAESARIQGAVKAQKEKLAKEEQVLKRGQELLENEKPGGKISIGGAIYAYEQVNDDVLHRVASCEVLRRKILSDEQSLSKLQKAYEDGCEVIHGKTEELRQARIEFEAEKAELAALRVQQHINEVIGKVYSTADVNTELGRARKAFEKRLNSLRAGAEFDREIGRFDSGVVQTWNKELGIPTETAASAVEKYFQVKSSPLEALEESPENEQ